MGNGMENLMERLEEEEKRERDKRNRWRKRLKLGVSLAFSGVTILAFAKSLSAGFTVLGISFMFPYLLYEFYNEC